MRRPSALSIELAARLEHLLSGLGLTDPQREGGHLRYRRKGALSVCIDGPKRGAWIDFEAAEGGGPLKLIEHILGVPREDARMWAMDFLGWRGGIPRDYCPPAVPTRTTAPRRSATESLAVQIWRERGPIFGTEAEVYLRGRGITCGLDRVRFHPSVPPKSGDCQATRSAYPAAVFAFTSLAHPSEACSVQVVLLENGRKAPLEVAKRSLGAVAGKVIVLQEEPGPLILAEGPETALSAVTAGAPGTVGAVGGVSQFAKAALASPLPDVLLIGDGDEEGSRARAAVQKAAAQLHDAGKVVRLLELPPTGEDLNDILQRCGPEEVQLLIREALAAPPWRPAPAGPFPFYPDPGVPLSEGESAVEQAVGSFFRDRVLESASSGGDTPAPQEAIRVALGVGKTEATIRQIVRASETGRRFVIFVPQHRLSHEYASRLNEKAGAVIASVWLGPDQKDPAAEDGQTMCRIPEQFATWRSASGRAREICTGCSMKRACGYQRQRRMRQPLVLILPANMASARRLKRIEELSGVIFDETPHSFLLAGFEAPRVLKLADLDTLRSHLFKIPRGDSREGVGLEADRIIDAIRSVFAVHPAGKLRRLPFIEAGITARDAWWMAKLEWSLKRKPEMDMEKVRATPAEQLARDLAAVREYNAVVHYRVRFWKLLGLLLEAEDREVAQGLVLEGGGAGEDSSSRRIRMRWRKRIHDDWQAVPTLLLDATLDEELTRQWFPRLELKADVRVEPDPAAVKRRQVVDWNASASKLIPFEGDSADKLRTKRNNRARIARLLEVKASLHGRALCIGQKELVALLQAEHGDRLGDRVAFEWFGNVRGIDKHRDAPYLLLVGRQAPGPAIDEAEAEVIFDADVERVETNEQGSRWYRREMKGLRLRGGGSASVQADVHPDPRVERIRRQRCDGELLQAEGRVRSNRRTAENPVHVDVVSDVVLDLTFDQVLTWDELQAEAGPLELMAARGAIGLNWASVAAILPDVFKSPELARKGCGHLAARLKFLRDLVGTRIGKMPISSISIGEIPLSLHSDSSWILTRYVNRSTGHSSRMLVRPDGCDPREIVESIVGPVCDFRLESATPDLVPCDPTGGCA